MADPSSPPEPAAGPSRPSLPLQPLQNPRFRHISRSAAKRESVQLLGSIKDLQLHFSRALNVEHKPGSGVGVKGLSTLGEEEDDEEAVRGSMAKPRLAERRPWKEVELPRIDPEAVKGELRDVMARVRELWSIPAESTNVAPMASALPIETGETDGAASGTALDSGMTRSHTSATLSQVTDTRQMLITTAQSVRRARELSLALISQPGRRVSGPRSRPGSAPPAASRTSSSRSSISTLSRPNVSVVPRQSFSTAPERKSSLGTSSLAGMGIGEEESDHLVDLRKAALEVLAGLRSLEERLRLLSAKSDDVEGQDIGVHPSDTLSPPNGPSRRGSTDLQPPSSTSRPSSSLSNLISEPETIDSSDLPAPGTEEDDFNLNLLAADVDLHKHLQTWEERILAEDRQYRAPNPDEGLGEREGVKWWIGVVEGLFLHEVVEGDEGAGGKGKGKWVDGDWEGRGLERIHDFITSHLPLSLDLLIPSPASANFRSSFLNRLSDGYILLIAANTSLHQSPKPWGFVSPSDMYDTLSAGQEEQGGDWTFRRVRNLTAWAAAIRHRFSLPLILAPSPSHPSSTQLDYLQSTPLPPIRDPATHRPAGRPIAQPIPKGSAQVAPAVRLKRETSGEGARVFDPLLIARRGEGWEGVLEWVLGEWVGAAAKEVKVAEEMRDGKSGKGAAAARGGWM